MPFLISWFWALHPSSPSLVDCFPTRWRWVDDFDELPSCELRDEEVHVTWKRPIYPFFSKAYEVPLNRPTGNHGKKLTPWILPLVELQGYKNVIQYSLYESILVWYKYRY